MNVLVKSLKQSDIEYLKHQFEQIDTDQTGMISASELREAFSRSGLTLDDENIDSMFTNIDYKGNNKLNYTEFIAATLSVN